MAVTVMVVVMRVAGGDDDLRLGRRVQDETQTQRTQCEQTFLEVVHDRLPEPGFLRSNPLGSEMQNWGRWRRTTEMSNVWWLRLDAGRMESPRASKQHRPEGSMGHLLSRSPRILAER
jgi:hypothetical protein